MKDQSKVGLEGIKLILEFRHYKLMKATSSVRDRSRRGGTRTGICEASKDLYCRVLTNPEA